MSNFRYEGSIYDENSCQALCERSNPICMAYDYNHFNKDCYTFYELIGSMQGDATISSTCNIKPRILRFETQIGKCERIDKNKILDTQAATEEGEYESSSDCQAKC